ncbi:MAG: Uma2 family endonuclease [Candidatus Cohnella colombiensis]|uniref:Uma2 family endonuclease n=1 Tax=Candidatus Cohnella colombiensis TaxID=3121368 RepID=A0AA95EUD5_9BACL|nr:MAG: Uma2 family endonuclease [Cohnella sp.]
MSGNQDDKNRIKEQSVTYEVYAAMPEDGYRYEIFDGELEMMSPGPSVVHQGIVGKLQFILRNTCHSEYTILIAPLDVILSPTNVVQPDLLMIHNTRLNLVTMRGVEGAPDLVVEIISPGSRSRDKVKKLRIYVQHGIPEYWIIDSESRVLEQYLLAGDHYELGNLFEGDDPVISDKLPCVSFIISDLFKDTVVQKLLSSN